MGLYGEVEFSLVFSDFLATLNLTVTERVVATITKKKEFSFSGVAEEVAATITVGVTLVLSTPNAMPLLTQRHRPNHGALL
jgi:PleD family two-component response regulator